MAKIRVSYDLSERRACRLLDHPRGTQRYVSQARSDEDDLTRAIIALAGKYGLYSYRRIKALLQAAGWEVGTDRVQRIWRQEGPKVPQKQIPRDCLCLNDGSCIRLRPERYKHVWSYDFVEAQTHDGRKLRLMTLIDGFTRDCLAIRVARRINDLRVLETMAKVMMLRGVPEHVRSDNGTEMTSKTVGNWLAKVGARTLYIEPASPWENGYCESLRRCRAISIRIIMRDLGENRPKNGPRGRAARGQSHQSARGISQQAQFFNPRFDLPQAGPQGGK